jgi:RNA polymerase sigma factor (sigma-70 family)
MGLAPKTATIKSDKAAWNDAKLVRACLASDRDAWGALLDRYKNLIFSIPIKYGFSREDAADIFQSVCVELLKGLPQLREVNALPKWIIQVSAHMCMRQRREQGSLTTSEPVELESLAGPDAELPDGPLKEAEQEQALRQALAELSPRCRELVRMLFFEVPSRPYAEVAASLGLAPGSIGFIRGRCLQKLHRHLDKAPQ